MYSNLRINFDNVWVRMITERQLPIRETHISLPVEAIQAVTQVAYNDVWERVFLRGAVVEV